MKNCCPFLFILFCFCSATIQAQSIENLKKGFLSPPDSAKPGVYWYFMDGNLSRESMTKDLESMKEAGIGNLMFLEVNVGVPRGNVDFFSEEWQSLFAHAVKEAERLDIEISLGLGPGWTGSGGPWVKPEESMKHIVAGSVDVSGGKTIELTLPVPSPKAPYFGIPEEMKEQWENYYEDIALLAIPRSEIRDSVPDIDEKALYYRPPYTSVAGVKPYFISSGHYPATGTKGLDRSHILDISHLMDKNGKLRWEAPPGEWILMRFVSRNNGASTRPAPLPGLGFESDKFDKVSLNRHLDHFIGSLLMKSGTPDRNKRGGLKRLHMDSWEMGAQNWSGNFREEFRSKRGYDPLPFYPLFCGITVENREISERFLWDLRQTAQELVIENHAKEAKRYARKHQMDFSIEPYDMNPTADLELGDVADIPMCEFWSKGYGFNSAFSCIEATSIGHINGSSIIAAEAFTADPGEGWKQYPAVMKNQGDWALSTGINRFVFHTFQNQFLADSLRPGATMGPYGVHWDRNQTWWPMVHAYHEYLSRCQYLLQQGRAVADILFLTPEGAPHVFTPPLSAMTGSDTIPDRKGYNFDGVAPGQLMRASVENGMILFPSGARYRMLVLPLIETMTPELLEKIGKLIADGAVVVGIPPVKSPSLSGYPQCDTEVMQLSRKIWSRGRLSEEIMKVPYGKGIVISGKGLEQRIDNLYPHYDMLASILQEMGVSEDFRSDNNTIRYTHRTHSDWDIYFLSNKTDQRLAANCQFRVNGGTATLWDPINGKSYRIEDGRFANNSFLASLQFEPYQSFFLVFDRKGKESTKRYTSFPGEERLISTLEGSWEVAFDSDLGGPGENRFHSLIDWTQHPDDGIRYYSGIATYKKEFTLPDSCFSGGKRSIFIDLGEVYHMARVKVNGKEAGIVWTSPWKLEITSLAKKGVNRLEIEVANLWVNRLIGDEFLPSDGIEKGQWPDWLTNRQSRTGERISFTTYPHYTKRDPLVKSGLLGPVTIKLAK